MPTPGLDAVTHRRRAARRITAFAAALLLALSSAAPADVGTGCRDEPRVVDDRFRVHGRLPFANGNPSLRMWPIGTRRLLGVRDDGNPIVPDNVRRCLMPPSGNGFERTTYGDFVVCPFTRRRPGVMQMVCIASARNLVVEDVADRMQEQPQVDLTAAPVTAAEIPPPPPHPAALLGLEQGRPSP